MKKSFSKITPLWYLLIVFVFLFCAVQILLYDMNFGPGAFSDSATYIISGKNLITEGRLGIYAPDGQFRPLSLHPPLFSLVLAPFYLLDLDIFTVVKWLDIILFCLTLTIITIGVLQISHSYILGLGIGVLFLVSKPMLKNFDAIMSESLFLVFTFSSFILLILYCSSPSRILFWGAIAAAGLASITRYAGFVSVLSGFFILMFFSAKNWKRRLRTSFQFLFFSSVPIVFWFVGIFIQNGTIGSRTIVPNIDLIKSLSFFKKAIMENLVLWLPFPETIFPHWENKATAIAVLILVTAILAVMLFRKNSISKQEDQKGLYTLVIASLIFIVCYIGFLVVSLFSSVVPDYNERMFSPLQPFVLIVILGLLVALIRAYKLSNWLSAIPVTLILMIGLSFWRDTLAMIRDHHINPIGFGTPDWRSSATIRAVRLLPKNLILYSNEATGVLIQTGRYPYSLSDLDFLSLRVSDTYPEKNSIIALILFSPSRNCGTLCSMDEVEAQYEQQLISFTPEIITEDGKIYFFVNDLTNK
ncbi:MAG: hypothetical protein NTZ74_12225 [Chloroflexi bacterium]|nr:hypothetical protein [Chloroflexota bacterium]